MSQGFAISLTQVLLYLILHHG